VTAEVTPHHLLLTDEALRSYDTRYRMNPPLRTEADRQACVAALADGTLDCIATDHAPHPREEKNVEFDAAPNGVIGLETAVAVLLDRLVARKEISLMRLVEALSAAPARILGLAEQGSLAPGKLADVTVLDLEQEAVIDAARFRSLYRNTPIDGWTVRGQALLTLVGGPIVHDARLG
jgi:dihydroorotase